MHFLPFVTFAPPRCRFARLSQSLMLLLGVISRLTQNNREELSQFELDVSPNPVYSCPAESGSIRGTGEKICFRCSKFSFECKRNSIFYSFCLCKFRFVCYLQSHRKRVLCQILVKLMHLPSVFFSVISPMTRTLLFLHRFHQE